MNYTDQELLQLMTGPESDRVERKESFKGSAPETVRQAVCAFANDLPNHQLCGVVFIGVRDDGAPTGLNVTDELLRALADIKTDGKIVPPPTLTVEQRNLAGAEVAVITVKPSDVPPVSFDGRIWIRIGARRGLASLQDESSTKSAVIVMSPSTFIRSEAPHWPTLVSGCSMRNICLRHSLPTYWKQMDERWNSVWP